MYTGIWIVMWEVVIDEFVWTRAGCRVVLGVFVVVSDGTNTTRMRLRLFRGKEMDLRHANVLDYLEGKKLGKKMFGMRSEKRKRVAYKTNAVQHGDCCKEGKADNGTI